MDQAHQAAEEAVADMLFGPEEAPTEEVEQPTEEVELEAESDDDIAEGDEREVKPVEEGEDSDLVEVEFDGQLIEAPKAVAEALMRQADYTKKTQEVAEQRKQAEILQGELKQREAQFQFAESIQGDVLKAQQLEATANQYHEYLRNNIDNLSSTDIEKLRLGIDDARRERDQLVEQVKGKQATFQQAQEQSTVELLNKGTEILRSKIPGWGEEHQRAVREFALNVGYTEAEVAQVVDPRHAEVLWMASQYKSLQQGKVAAIKKVQSAPTIKPKARNPMPNEVKDKLNLRKKLKSEKLTNHDKASLIGDSIADKFFS